MAFLVLLAVGLIFAKTAVNAEEIHNYHMCRNSLCDIYDVFIDPCPEALDDKPCEIPQGVNASIQIKYVPKFTPAVPKNRLFAVVLFDMPFMDMDSDACAYTQCPIVAKAERTWEYSLYISESYPKGSYTVKYKLWDDEKSSDQCCFSFKLKIV